MRADTHQLDVRRLNAVTRKLQRMPQKTVFPSMRCPGEVVLHTDSGYRRMEQIDDVKAMACHDYAYYNAV